MAPTGRVSGDDCLGEHGGGGRSKLARLAALLRAGGRPPYANNLTKREMESLTAICDTLLPSVDVSGDTADESLVEFYRTSASMAGTPERMGGMLSGGLRHPAVGLLRVALWLLSTWYGTLAMCGGASLSPEFPYLPRRFCRIERRRREEVLLAWSLSSFFLYRMLFKCLKFVTMRLHFQQVDENNHNPSWKAIGYCGPDPDLVDRSQHLEEEEKGQCMGPLHRALVDMSDPSHVIKRTLEAAGFPTTVASASPHLTVRCDAVVVGSGSGGGVVSGVLAMAGHKVVVLEKGDYFPTTTLSLLEGPSLAEMYESGGLLATDDVGALLLAGATVGGGSTINWSACLRTPDHVLNEWCDRHELKLFGGGAFQRALDAVCGRMGVTTGGAAEEGFSNAVLRRGCLELGYPVSKVPLNAPPDHHCGWCHLGCKDSKKQSTPETWLADMAASGNGVILPGCNAVKVLTRRERGEGRSAATGVLAMFGEKGVLVVESKVTVVACGALNTPGLLRRSGLRNPNIGRHLHVHPTVMAWGYFPEKEEEGKGGGGLWPEKGKKSYEGGILTSMSTVAANFDTSGYGAVIQTPALHPAMFSVVTPWVSAADFRRRMSRFSRTATLFALARDKGSGSSLDYPNSLPYHLDATDEENLRKGLERMLRILEAAGATEIGTYHCSGEWLDVRGSTAEELEEFVRRAAGRAVRDLSAPVSSAHQMGSCRMGVNPEASAVDPGGEAWEVEGLFVADTSVFPTALGVNPMVTVQAVAYCTAQSLLELLQKKKKKEI